MFRPKGSVLEEGGYRRIFVMLLAIAAAILLIAQPVVANAAEQEFPVEAKDGTLKTIKIRYDDWMRNISATVDGKPLEVSKERPYPVVLGKNSQKIVGIYGPVIVFEGNSKCYLIGGRWIGYPPGTVCP